MRGCFSFMTQNYQIHYPMVLAILVADKCRGTRFFLTILIKYKKDFDFDYYKKNLQPVCEFTTNEHETCLNLYLSQKK